MTITREALRDELERSRSRTRDDLAALVTDYLEDTVEGIRRSLARASDSALLPEQQLPDQLRIDLVNVSIAIRAEIRRRGRA